MFPYLKQMRYRANDIKSGRALLNPLSKIASHLIAPTMDIVRALFSVADLTEMVPNTEGASSQVCRAALMLLTMHH